MSPGTSIFALWLELVYSISPVDKKIAHVDLLELSQIYHRYKVNNETYQLWSYKYINKRSELIKSARLTCLK